MTIEKGALMTDMPKSHVNFSRRAATETLIGTTAVVFTCRKCGAVNHVAADEFSKMYVSKTNPDTHRSHAEINCEQCREMWVLTVSIESMF
jgi:hypothetical protein